MTIDAALGDLEHRLAVVESALDAGEAPELPKFVPEPLAGHPSPGDLERFAAARRRLEACQRRLREARVGLLQEHDGIVARRRAATAYAGER